MTCLLIEFLFSKVPIYEQRNDGRDNLLGALVIAGHYIIPEVCFLALPLLKEISTGKQGTIELLIKILYPYGECGSIKW